jgi:hypothetical protein
LGLTVKKINIQEEIVLPNNSIEIAKITGLLTSLNSKALQVDLTNANTAISNASQAIIGLSNSIYTQIQANALFHPIISTSLNISGLSLSDLSSNATINHPSALILAINGTPLVSLDNSTGMSLNNHFDCTTLASGTTSLGDATVNGGFEVISSGSAVAKIGNSGSYTRCVNGHHWDSYTASNNAGRGMNLQNYANSYIRVGSSSGSLGINCTPSYPLDVVGVGNFTGVVRGLSFTSTSDARIKSDVLPASIDECVRLIKEVQPQTYRRTDLDESRRIGYIANHWDANLTPGMRNIMGPVTDSDSLLSLDYSRIVAVLHGALLSALARIEALENNKTVKSKKNSK